MLPDGILSAKLNQSTLITPNDHKLSAWLGVAGISRTAEKNATKPDEPEKAG